MAEQSSPGAESGASEAAQVAQVELRPIWPAPPTLATTTGRRWATSARVAATVGGLLFFVAAWTPWATALTSGDLRKGPSGPQFTYSLTAAELGAPPIAALTGSASSYVFWSFLTILGALLTPLIWQRTRPWLRWVAAILYAFWAVICALVLFQTYTLLFQTVPALTHAVNGPYTTTIEPYGMRLAIYAASPAIGLYFAIITLTAPLAALVLAAIALRANPPAFRRRTPTIHGEVETPTTEAGQPTAKKRPVPGVGAVSSGLLLWGWGFFLLPWASLNCTQSPLLVAQCQGLPVALALQAGLFATRDIFDPAAAPYAISGLLLLSALMGLITVWRREITRTLCAWLSGWVVFALACALIAINGAQIVVHNGASIGVPTGTWRGDMGTLIVFLGLLLVVIGLAPLWAVAIRSAARRDPPSE